MNKIFIIIIAVCLIAIPLSWFKAQYLWMNLPDEGWKPVEKPIIMICKGKWKRKTLVIERSR